MIKVTAAQCAKLLQRSEEMAGVELEEERGKVAADLHAACTIAQMSHTFRMKALEKERARLLKDHAQKDGKGDIRYGDSPDGDPAKRPVLFINQKKADAAFAVWVKKVEAVDAEIVELALAPIADDFFAKPNPVMAKHGVRIAFLPFMQKAQAALKAAAPKATKKGKK